MFLTTSCRIARSQRFKAVLRSANARRPLSQTSKRVTAEASSSIPANAGPKLSNKHSNALRALTWVLGAGIGGLLYFSAVHSDVESESSTTQNLLNVTAVSAANVDQVNESRQKLGVYVWGANRGNVAAPGEDAADIIPSAKRVEAFAGKVLRDLAFGNGHAACIDEKGNLLQWGSRFDYGSVDAKNSHLTSKPPLMTLHGKDLVQVTCTENKVYALARNGDIFCLSANGPQAPERPSVKLEIPNSRWRERVTGIQSGNHHLAAVTNSGRLFTLPADSKGNECGQLGPVQPPQIVGAESGLSEAPPKMLLVGGLESVTIKQVACGDRHTLIRTADGRVLSFGDNTYGQLGRECANRLKSAAGDSTAENVLINDSGNGSQSPDQQPTTNTPFVVKVAAGGNTSLFVVDGPKATDVFSAGMGLHGQLGNGTVRQVMARPQPVKGLSGLKEYDEKIRAVRPIRVEHIEVAPGGTHCAAVLATAQASEEGTKWFSSGASPAVVYGNDVQMWGHNQCGELAAPDGGRSNATTPIYPRAIVYNEDAATLDQSPATAIGKTDKTEEAGDLVLPITNAVGGSSGLEVGRLQLAPPGKVPVSDANGKLRHVNAYQHISLGKDLTAVYFKLAGNP
ncbi:regulator of chromosome condensation 1/beta-lactamase-inhibitor protein II [Gaertneriomyces semiglobifer]|nr:regulator of chromosome condensation 1/beta-lactamase-inhibitor protein II [Gaertneriomyces semiglobifer]